MRRVKTLCMTLPHSVTSTGQDYALICRRPRDTWLAYGAMVTSLELPALQIWRLYRGRAYYENRIKELGLDSFNMAQFSVTEASLGIAMLAYNLMSLFRQAVMKSSIHHTLTTLNRKVFAVGAFWDSNAESNIF